MLQSLIQDLQALGSPKKALNSARFFKTGKGQYGEGDIFWGITVPEQRMIAKKYHALELSDIQKLLQNPVHECRLTALLILVEHYKKADHQKKKELADFYLTQTKYINNWDLVDSSADKIVGEFLFGKEPSLLLKLATSKSLWERRIAIIATLSHIRKGKFDTTFTIAEILLPDSHDLIHKAVGWMLREIGKKDQPVLEKFLQKHCVKMPRTMLRYAIERFPQELRKKYMSPLSSKTKS